MVDKPEESQEPKEQRPAPATGQGAASALDAMIKRRPPQPGAQTHPEQPLAKED